MEIPLLVVILLLFTAALFALTETAFSAVSRNRVRTGSERGDERAKKALFVLDHFDWAITTLLICTNIVHITIATIVTVIVTRLWGLNFVSVSTVITTIIVFFAADMLPKSIAKKNSEKYALFFAGMLIFLMKLFRPLAAVLEGFTRVISKNIKAEPELTVTEDELYNMIEDMEEEGSIDESRSDLFESALDFHEVTVEDVITPRVSMIAIDIDDEPRKNFDLIMETNHSRLPVYRKTPDNIIGVLQIRKYMKAYLHSRPEIPDIAGLMDPVYYADHDTGVRRLLTEMSEQKLNLAVIHDIYGGTLGIATIEDIIEELVGEIWDETDVTPSGNGGGEV